MRRRYFGEERRGLTGCSANPLKPEEGLNGPPRGILCKMQEITLAPAKFIGQALDKAKIPALSRPEVPPNAPATKELVEWGVKKFEYSLLAHVRAMLRGTLLLADAGIEAAVIVLCRHLYEWNMQTAYVYVTVKAHLESVDYQAAWEFFLRTSGGNNWVKRHGTRYVPEFPATEVEGSIRLKHAVKAYKQYRAQKFGSESVDDDYSYLSERSHPNGFCLQPYMKIDFPNDVRFVEPKSDRLPGILHSCVMEWAMVSVDLLGLVQEKPIRGDLVQILRELAGR